MRLGQGHTFHTQILSTAPFGSAKPMRELLPFLLLRGLTGTASEVDMRLLAWLANPDVNRKVFGQPLPDIIEYYGEEFYACRTGVERRKRNAQRNGKHE